MTEQLNGHSNGAHRGSKTWGQSLRNIRENLELSRDAFADKVGCSGAMIALYETGKSNISEDGFKKLVKIYPMVRKIEAAAPVAPPSKNGNFGKHHKDKKRKAAAVVKTKVKRKVPKAGPSLKAKAPKMKRKKSAVTKVSMAFVASAFSLKKINKKDLDRVKGFIRTAVEDGISMKDALELLDA